MKVRRDFTDKDTVRAIMEELETFLKEQIAIHSPLINTSNSEEESTA